MYIDYSKILSTNLRTHITEEKLKELKDLAEKERTYLKRKYSPNIIAILLSKKAYEIAYINMKNQEKSDNEKAIIASNIVFDDQRFAKILLNGKFDFDTIKSFVSIIGYLKNKMTNSNLNEKDQKYLTIADNFAKRLANHFSKYIGVVDQNIIINKIIEILEYKPELLENNSSKHTR